MSKVFICHRHESEMAAGRLAESLKQDYGSDVFLDTGIRGGEDYEKKLRQTVGHAQIVLVLIGPGGVAARDRLGRTLEDSNSWVRREIEYALEHEDIQVIPVLLGHDSKPSKEELPESLAPLAKLQPLRLYHETWRADVERLKDNFGSEVWKQSQAQSKIAGSLVAARKAVSKTSAEQLARKKSARAFSAPGTDPKAVAEDLRQFYQGLGMQSRVTRAEIGGYLVEARHAGKLRAMAGLQSAIEVLVMSEGDDLLIHISAGKWGDKALAVGLSPLLPPTLLTAAYGTHRQSKLPAQTLERVEQFLLESG